MQSTAQVFSLEVILCATSQVCLSCASIKLLIVNNYLRAIAVMRTVRFYTSIRAKSIYTNYEVTSVLATTTGVFTLGR